LLGDFCVIFYMKRLLLTFSLLFFFSCEDKKEKDDSDTQNPSVEILSPANNADVWGTITIKVFAEDDNAVEHVELLVAGDKLGTDNAKPYEFEWNTTSYIDNQIINILAVAYDDAENFNTSSVNVKVVNAAHPDTVLPTVQILSPANNSEVWGTIKIKVFAEDNNGIERVELFVDGDTLGEDLTKPYEFTWNTTFFDDSKLVNILAVAYDNGKNFKTSSINVEIQNTSHAPKPVTLSLISYTENTATFEWSKFSDGHFKEYRLYRSSDGKIDTSSTLIFRTDDINTITYTDTLDLFSHSYSLYVFSESMLYSPSNIQTYDNFYAPNISDAIVLNDQQITLKWVDNTYVEDGFEIYISTSEYGDYVNKGLVATDITEFTVDSLEYGVGYFMKVRAYKDSIYSNFSSLVQTRTIFTEPSAPVLTIIDYQTIKLEWQDNSSFEDGYKIERRASGNQYLEIASVDSNIINYLDNTVTSYDSTLSYRISAFTDLNQSNKVNNQIYFGFAPSALSVKQLTETSVEINWQDNSSFEDGFTIEKNVNASGYVEAGTVNSNIVSFTETALNSSDKYIYRVRAYASDKVSTYSDSSNFEFETVGYIYISNAGNDFTGNGTVNYPYETIQKGINVANTGDIVLVSDGTYLETIRYNQKAITVASHYVVDGLESHISNTIIDGEYQRRGVWIDGNNSVLKGLTITKGRDSEGSGIYVRNSPTIENCNIVANGETDFGNSINKGAGIFISSYASPLFINCKIENNKLFSNNDTYGAGVYAENGSNVTFRNCSISENENHTKDYWDTNRGAGMYFGGHSLTIYDSEINQNHITVYASNSSSVYGAGIYMGTGTLYMENSTVSSNKFDSEDSQNFGGIYAYGQTVEIINSTISNNSDGGIYSGSNSKFTNTTISGNATKGIYTSDNSTITNSVISNNTNFGLYVEGSNSSIENTTITYNGTGIFAYGATISLMNTISYFNTTSQIDGTSSSTITIDYSDIQNGVNYGSWATGTGNIDTNPLFNSTTDYHLSTGSPCINTGNIDAIYNDVDGSRNDMGAYGGPKGDW